MDPNQNPTPAPAPNQPPNTDEPAVPASVAGQVIQPQAAPTPSSPAPEASLPETLLTPETLATPQPTVAPDVTPAPQQVDPSPVEPAPSPVPTIGDEPQVITPAQPTIPVEPASIPPASQPVAEAATSPAPLPGQISPAAGPTSREDFEKLKKKSFPVKKLVISVTGLVVLAGAFIALNLMGILPFLGGMKTVTYKNGDGSTYSLKFYASNEQRKLGDSSLGELISPSAGKLNSLVSKKGKAGKKPIQILIADEKISGNVSDSQLDSFCNKSKAILSVRNAAANTDIHLCDLLKGDSQAEGYIYMGMYKANDRLVVVGVMPDMDFDKLSNVDEDEAKKLLDTAGLEPYHEDIKTIVGSIKIVSD